MDENKLEIFVSRLKISPMSPPRMSASRTAGMEVSLMIDTNPIVMAAIPNIWFIGCLILSGMCFFRRQPAFVPIRTQQQSIMIPFGSIISLLLNEVFTGYIFFTESQVR